VDRERGCVKSGSAKWGGDIYTRATHYCPTDSESGEGEYYLTFAWGTFFTRGKKKRKERKKKKKKGSGTEGGFHVDGSFLERSGKEVG